MAQDKNQNKDKKGSEKTASGMSIQRRTLLKAMVGVPVLGALAFEVAQKNSYDISKKKRIVKELGLNDIEAPSILKSSSKDKRDLIRVGMIGFGNRAKALSSALGFLHPLDTKNRRDSGSLENWLEQDDLNVAVTGICDVFDLHAENGLATARNEVRPGNPPASSIPVKRYLNYQEMLDDKNIDAVMIATPDHHHAPIAIAAARAGKHIYCEKSPVQREWELNALYDAVKESKVTYQLGHQITKNVIFQQAKEIVKRDILGKITLVETTTNRNSASGAWIRHLDKNGNLLPGDEKSIDWEQWLGNRPQKPFTVDRYYNWTKWFDYDMGMIGQLFTHEFDAVNQLLRIGIPATVSSSGGIYYWKDNREMPDSLHCVFEYPNHDLTLLYSGNLANSNNRGRVFMGHDATMELGGSISITPDGSSTRYKKQLAEGIISPSEPMITMNPNSGKVDAVTSATEKYYSSRGLTNTFVNGKKVDVTHLHVKEWIDCIRSGELPTANIERAYEEGAAILMAQKSYLEKRQVKWDPVNKKIV